MVINNARLDPTAYISLGSNIEDREYYLHEALRRIQQLAQVKHLIHSNIYETKAVGYTEQAMFLNMAIGIYTELSAVDLLNALQIIESDLGRKRDIHWGPRTIDLDLLLYAQERIITEALELPHPRMYERAFVLIPLLEILQPDQQQALSLIKKQWKDMSGKDDVILWKKTT